MTDLGRPFGRWLPVPGFAGLYDVASDGRVWSRRSGRALSGTPIKGYTVVRLSKDGVSYLRPVHRLVCEAFHGACPEDKEMVGHLDGNPENNHSSNLAWITRSENTAHSIAHGTFKGVPPAQAGGEAHSQAKLTSEQVAEIRSSQLGHKPIARLYGVSERQIRRIRKGEKWKTSGLSPQAVSGKAAHQAQGRGL